MRDNISAEAISTLSRDVVPVCYLVELEYGDSRYMSTNISLSALGQTWLGASVKVDRSNDWKTAQIQLDNSDSSLTGSALNSEWRGSMCNIWLAIFRPDAHSTGRYAVKGYVKTGYSSTEYTQPSEVIAVEKIFSGVVSSASQIDQLLTLNLTRPQITSLFSPRQRVSAPTFNHIPVEGTVIQWNGDTLELTRGN